MKQQDSRELKKSFFLFPQEKASFINDLLDRFRALETALPRKTSKETKETC